MSSIRFSSFGAATVPLSKIVPDKDLDLRPYGVIARYCRAPATADDWPTETLEWGDVPPSDTVVIDNGDVGVSTPPTTVYTATKTVDLTPIWTSNAGNLRADSEIKVNDNVVATLGVLLTEGNTKTFPKTRLYAGDVLTFVMRSTISAGKVTCRLLDDGFYIGAKTFNLAGKWLALGIDMHGLTATVKIQGVEIPYEDYAKYFPIAPTELTVPEAPLGTSRPVIKVYK